MLSEAKWEFIHAGDTDWQADTNGVYTIIHRVETPMTHKEYAGIIVQVRLDLMTDDGNPVVSFVGKPGNVRKALMQWIADRYKSIGVLSMEHAAYIGYELHRASVTPNYVQD